MLACVMSGLRWSLTQTLLEKEKYGMDNPAATILFISPIMAFFLLVASLIVENPFGMFKTQFFDGVGQSFITMCAILFGGIIASCMVYSEFVLIKLTSVVSLSVAGIFKEALTIVLSVLIFGDVMTAKNTLGLIITLAGIAIYNYVKMKKHFSADTSTIPPTRSISLSTELVSDYAHLTPEALESLNFDGEPEDFELNELSKILSIDSLDELHKHAR
ncbi:putative sugar phosphate/phosphate translocator [Zancudomyces culisetae]|uniref:Putative sugar phosphate/phosphate translocator n=1 Tax=Zancudomyces culisetae TaxID=1213189 RepID=A0A1R1PVI5_ZANCU|nr:putative sugar phosphate/phosphate translocator [Zancudomyces culisetae]|eukprot:OMH84987.1 putative sugar phosphate/phosphate translocator [Zancudomyces culisetae]